MRLWNSAFGKRWEIFYPLGLRPSRPSRPYPLRPSHIYTGIYRGVIGPHPTHNRLFCFTFTTKQSTVSPHMAQSTEQAASTAILQKEISRLRHELKTAAESNPAASEQIRIGDYLLERLAQLGVTVRSPSRRTPVGLRYLNHRSIDRLRCSGRLQPRWVPQ